MYIFNNPFTWVGCNTQLIFKWSLTGLNSKFSIWTGCLISAIEPSLSNYLPIARGGIIGFITFPAM